jgi:hypothetical protein
MLYPILVKSSNEKKYRQPNGAYQKILIKDSFFIVQKWFQNHGNRPLYWEELTDCTEWDKIEVLVKRFLPVKGNAVAAI